MSSCRRGPVRGRDVAFQLTVWLIGLAVLLPTLAAQTQTATQPPATRIVDAADTLHGVVIPDPYRWLEDQQAQATREWIDAQNTYTQSLLSRLPGREAIEKRLTDLMKIDVVGTPTARNGRYFFSKRLKDQDLYVIYMRDGMKGEDQVLIDPHPWSDDNRTSANMLGVSNDGTIMAYGIRQGGEDEVEVRFLDVMKR